MTDIDLKAVRNAVNEILLSAHGEPSLNGEPINWGDLTCWSVRRWVDDDGDFGWQVRVSEASSSKLAAHIDGELQKRGFPPMDVETQW